MNGACQLLAKHAFDCQQHREPETTNQHCCKPEPGPKQNISQGASGKKWNPSFISACITSSSAQTKAGHSGGWGVAMAKECPVAHLPHMV